tara:strand:- start:136 stop:753 length:618 start_codon:yes stop_codon:yes gene_type:complete
MRKTLLIFVITLFFLNSCASVNPSILNPHPNPLPNKLKSLNFGLETNQTFQLSSVKSATVQTDFATIFSRTLDQNICEVDRVKWGYADIRIVFDDWNYIKSFIPLTVLGVGFYPWFLLGGKFLWYERLIQVEIGIYDSNKSLLKKYIIDSKSETVGVSLYSSFRNYYPHRLSGIEVIHYILQKFENQIKNDVQFLNEELIKSGSI